MELEFAVAGVPIPQGSMTSYGPGKMVHANEQLEPWRHAVGWTARKCRPGGWVQTGPFGVEVTFYFARPASMAKRVTFPAQKKNDIDKLGRAILDALAKIIFENDGQVVDLVLRKRFGMPHADIGVDHLL